MSPRGTRNDGGTDAFRAFYKATAQRIFRSACRMTAGDRELASDALQDAYLVLWREWPQRQCLSHDHNRRYVLGIAGHKVADWYRHRREFGEPDDELDTYSIDDDLAERLDERAALGAVRELIESQPPRRRLVATMYFIDDMGYAEIAQALDITESTARTQVERFLALLKPLTCRFTDTNRGGERS